MKRAASGVPSLILLFASIAVFGRPLVVKAQTDDTLGWLEGTVRGEDGTPLGLWVVSLLDNDGNRALSAQSDSSSGGMYSIRNIKPGVYELEVRNFGVADHGNDFRQQRYFGVAIKKGVRSTLNFTLKEGKSREFDEIVKPNVATQNVMLLTAELENLRAQVAELKKAIEELKKK